MGVGAGFWEVVKPVCRQSEDLHSLQGKRLAIDISFWIVQQEAVLRDRARKPHLRLLFFRVVTLVAKIGAFPVFIVDGDAPLLKLPARIERFSRMSGIPAEQLKGNGNHRNQTFLDNVEECVELLELLGVPVLRAKGEAEALCAELQRTGVVDACVTPDSDAFLHGANCVIQTLQADVKNPLVETYYASDILSELKLGREHLIALALLVGCDYNSQGVPGIGYAKAIRLVRCFPAENIIEQLKRWGRAEFPSFEEIKRMNNEGLEQSNNDERETSGRKEPHCSLCGHPGSKKLHSKLACKECGPEAGCVEKLKGFRCSCKGCTQAQRRKKDAKDINWWTKLWAKISAIQGFPDEQIIELFLNSSSNIQDVQSLSSLEWRPPRMELLEEFLASKLHWDASYTRQKALPLLTHFCLESMVNTTSVNPNPNPKPGSFRESFTPDSIERIKVEHGRQLYLLNWKALDPGANECLTTVEEMALVRSACSDLVAQFEAKNKLKQMFKKVSSRVKKKRPDSTQRSITSFYKPDQTPPEAIESVVVVVDSEDDEVEPKATVKRRLF